MVKQQNPNLEFKPYKIRDKCDDLDLPPTHLI